MTRPFFYYRMGDAPSSTLVLDEETSKHIVQVLRMKKGESLNLTDGNGNIFSCEIADNHKKHCEVVITSRTIVTKPSRSVSIAISLLKNPGRFEWFLEKATELGVRQIIPLVCERTEKEKFRHDRLTAVLVSAMLQSQQAWLPVLHEPIAYELLFRQEEVASISHKFIAHCLDKGKRNLMDVADPSSAQIILIGPEGDFSPAEIELALGHRFEPVSLGETRLRAETAGMVAAAILCVA